MDNELTHITVDFNNHAKKLFFLLYDKFVESIKHLDRRKDENVFQQQQAKYLHTLKDQLETIAREILHNNREVKNINQFNKKLIDEINMYLNEFQQKTRSL